MTEAYLFLILDDLFSPHSCRFLEGRILVLLLLCPPARTLAMDLRKKDLRMDYVWIYVLDGHVDYCLKSIFYTNPARAIKCPVGIDCYMLSLYDETGLV